MKKIFVAILLLGLNNCGGGGGSEQVTKPVPEPIVKEPITGIPVIVTTFDSIGSDTHACHATNVSTSTTTFSEISQQAGLNFSHSMPNGDGVLGMSGGVAASDIDNDSWLDLYVVGGEGQANLLLKNQGDGSFKDIAESAGVQIQNKSSGPAFADIDGDGLVDLFVGSVGDSKPRLYKNLGDENFQDITEQSGLDLPGNNFSASWGDFDKDNDLDLFVTHWSSVSKQYYPYLWKNNGNLTFTDVSLLAGIPMLGSADSTFTPTFADINNDGWLDLLLVADFYESRLFVNNKNGTFTDITDENIFTAHAGMGSAVGDYDNDGDLDWFVSAISYEDTSNYSTFLLSGNRFYENQGSGNFVDKTEETGVYFGYWGWAACFGDFNNDGNLDLFHVNGMIGDYDDLFKTDPSRMFISNGNGSFTESSLSLGIEDKGVGRGLVCFDYDRDGDLDLYIANYDQPPKLYCNHGNNNNFVNIKLIEKSSNKQSIGARIYVKTNLTEQMRELRLGNNYVSQNPVEAHFGLGDSTEIDQVKIVWPDGEETKINNIEINKFVVIERL